MPSIFQKTKQIYLAVYGPFSAYLALLTGDEAAFWRSPARSTWAEVVAAWKTGPGWKYLLRAWFVRLVLPLGLVVLGGLAVIAVIFCYFRLWR